MPSIETSRDGVLDSQVPAAYGGDGTMASFGEELRRQRELRSVSLREISDATKINIRFLEALEENDFKHLPGGQFNKGFIRAYARHIGVDGEDMVNAYILEVRRQEEATPQGRTSSARQRLDPADKRALAALAILAVLVVLLALGIWFVFFHGKRAKSSDASREARPAKAVTAAPAAGAIGAGRAGGAGTPTSPAPPQAGVTPAGVSEAGAAGAAGTAAPSGPSGGERAAPGSSQTTAAPTATGEGRDGRVPSPAEGGEMALRVVPLQPVRFELRCDGKEAFSGTLEPGRPQSFTCTGVYEITVEDAGAVNLSVNGDRIYVGRPGQSIAGRHVSRANLPDFLNPPFEPARR